MLFRCEIKELGDSKINEMVNLCRDDFLDIVKSTYLGVPWYWWHSQKDSWERELKSSISTSRYRFGIVKDGRVLGFFVYDDHADGYKLLCWHMAPEIRGGSMVMKMLRTIEKRAQEEKKAIYLDISKAEAKELRFAVKRGYGITGEDKYLYHLKKEAK